jgi:hypothetical protein
MWLSYFGSYGFPVFPSLLFSLLSLYCLVPIYRGCRPIAPLLASGIGVGVTILFRHDVGVAAAVGSALTLGLFHITQKLDTPNKIRALLRSVMIYAGGIALALVPPLALLLAAGGVHDMLLDLVLIPARIYVRMASLPFPSLVPMAREIMHLRLASLDQAAVYLPIVAVLLGIMAVLTFGRGQQAATTIDNQALISQRLWTLVQLTFFSLLFFLKGWVRVSPRHMALSIVPSLVIMTVWQFERRSSAAKILFGVGITWLLFISLPPMWNARSRFAENLAWAAADAGAPSNSVFALARSENGVFARARSENGSCFPPEGLERIRCFYISREEPAAIRYIQEHTAENEAIFVGLNRHDKIFVNDVLFYFVSKRPSVTKWDMFAPGVQTTIKIQSEIVGELQTRRPRYAVLTSKFGTVSRSRTKAPAAAG